MLITDWARAALDTGLDPSARACSFNRLPSDKPRLPTTPTKRNSRRVGRQGCSGLLHQEETKGWLIGSGGRLNSRSIYPTLTLGGELLCEGLCDYGFRSR